MLQETAYATDRDVKLHRRGLRPTENSTAAGTSFKITIFFNLMDFSRLQNVQTGCGGQTLSTIQWTAEGSYMGFDMIRA